MDNMKQWTLEKKLNNPIDNRIHPKPEVWLRHKNDELYHRPQAVTNLVFIN